MIRFFLAMVRQNSYFIAAFAVGVLFSVFCPNAIETPNCIRIHSNINSNNYKQVVQSQDIYEPKINLAAKPKTALKGGHGMVRPRFHKAELGIRNKLFVGVLTSPESISTFAIALNKTASKFIDKMMFFIDAPSAQRLNVSSLKLPGIVGFTDTRKVLKPFHLVKYVSDNFLEDYDFFFIIKDTGYVQAQRLYEFTKKISINHDVHIGQIIDNTSSADKVCSINSGILLSNSVMRKVQKSLDWCVKNFISKDDNNNMGQCVIHASQIQCSETIQGSRFTTFNLKKDVTGSVVPVNKDELRRFEESIVIAPLTKAEQYFSIHLYFLMENAVRINEAVANERASVMKYYSTAAESKQTVWPVASQPPAVPLSHFDVVRWEYFTLSHKYLDSDFSNIVQLSGSEKEDIQGVVSRAVSHVEETHNGVLKFFDFINGYKKCDTSRGVDYIIDAEFRETTSGKIVHKRLEVFKSLGKIEMVPVPYVTENVRVHVIIPVKSLDIERIMIFLKQYSINAMEKKDLQFLMLVFIYSLNESSKGEQDIFKEVKLKALSLSNKFDKVGNLIKWHSIKLPANTTDPFPQSLMDFVVLDSVLKKFSSESLVLLGRPNMEVHLDYFNRVRMNTISGFQIFSPIPFTEYHPEIIYNENHPQPPELEINKNNGHYDSTNYKHISFYTVDYLKARRKIKNVLPVVKFDKDIWKIMPPSVMKNDTYNHYSENGVYNMFLRNSNAHMLRAVEPSLRLKHPTENCAYCRTEAQFHDYCTKIQAFNLATRSQLGRLVLDYQAEINNIS